MKNKKYRLVTPANLKKFAAKIQAQALATFGTSDCADQLVNTSVQNIRTQWWLGFICMPHPSGILTVAHAEDAMETALFNLSVAYSAVATTEKHWRCLRAEHKAIKPVAALKHAALK